MLEVQGDVQHSTAVSWLSVVVVHGQGVVLQAFATAIVGDANTRRAPASIAIPKRRSAKPDRPKLGNVAKSNVKKMKMLAAFAKPGTPQL